MEKQIQLIFWMNLGTLFFSFMFAFLVFCNSIERMWPDGHSQKQMQRVRDRKAAREAAQQQALQDAIAAEIATQIEASKSS